MSQNVEGTTAKVDALAVSLQRPARLCHAEWSERYHPVFCRDAIFHSERPQSKSYQHNAHQSQPPISSSAKNLENGESVVLAGSLVRPKQDRFVKYGESAYSAHSILS